MVDFKDYFLLAAFVAVSCVVSACVHAAMPSENKRDTKEVIDLTQDEVIDLTQDDENNQAKTAGINQENYSNYDKSFGTYEYGDEDDEGNRPEYQIKYYYKILGVAPDASEADIRKAYKRLMLKWHSDKNSDDTEATKITQLITEAHVILGNKEHRAFYDEQLQQIENPLRAQAKCSQGLIRNVCVNLKKMAIWFWMHKFTLGTLGFVVAPLIGLTHS